MQCPRCDADSVRRVYLAGEPPQDRCTECQATVVADGGGRP